MSLPIRIQRKRTKGFKLPENTVCVNRPLKWGNFMKFENGTIYIDASYRRTVLDKWVILEENASMEQMLYTYALVVTNSLETQNPDLQHWIDYCKKLDVKELKAKNLACFCKYGDWCHADILLKIANK